jgi:hypothetical protein
MCYETLNVAPNIIVRSGKKPVLAGLTGRLQVRVENSGMIIARKLRHCHWNWTPCYFPEINYLYTSTGIHSDFSDRCSAELEGSRIDIFGKTIQSPVSSTYRNANSSGIESITILFYSFFWVVPRRLNFLWWRFWTHFLFRLHRSCEHEVKNYCPAIR